MIFTFSRCKFHRKSWFSCRISQHWVNFFITCDPPFWRRSNSPFMFFNFQIHQDYVSIQHATTNLPWQPHRLSVPFTLRKQSSSWFRWWNHDTARWQLWGQINFIPACYYRVWSGWKIFYKGIIFLEIVIKAVAKQVGAIGPDRGVSPKLTMVIVLCGVMWRNHELDCSRLSWSARRVCSSLSFLFFGLGNPKFWKIYHGCLLLFSEGQNRRCREIVRGTVLSGVCWVLCPL